MRKACSSATHLFVPDNERYEGSDRLWFDEHNHPVKAAEVDRKDSRYQLRRCYKLVSLIHVNRQLEFFFVAAARVVPGWRHECPIVYELAEQFVKAVGPGVMKMLIVDRGLIDGPHRQAGSQTAADSSAAQSRDRKRQIPTRPWSVPHAAGHRAGPAELEWVPSSVDGADQSRGR